MTIKGEKTFKGKGTEYIYSVETESNSFRDDLYNGTLLQCKRYCQENGLKLGEDTQIALIQTEDGIEVFTHDIEYPVGP